MSGYRILNLRGGTTPGSPAVGNVRPFATARNVALHQQFLAQDRIIGAGRRVLLRTGLFGAEDWNIPETDPDGTPAPTHPARTSARTVKRLAQVALTPGHILRAHLLALPSGETQQSEIGGGGGLSYVSNGRSGSVKIKVRWRAQTGYTADRDIEVSLPPSELTYGAQPSAAAQAWWSLIERRFLRILPASEPIPAVTLERYLAPGSTVDLEVQHVGSPRIVDLVIYEEPYVAARRTDRDTWTPAHLYTVGGEEPYSYYPSNYPQTRAREDGTDPALGSLMLADVSREMFRQLGPTLFGWSSHQEASSASINAESPGQQVTSTSWVHLTDENLSSWSEDAPGVSVGCGGYARRFRTSGFPEILRDRNGVVHTRCRAYARGKGTIRVQTKAHSYVDIPVDSVSYAWAERLHWLCCGRGPEDDAHVSIWAKAQSGHSLLIRDVWGHYHPEAPNAETPTTI